MSSPLLKDLSLLDLENLQSDDNYYVTLIGKD